MMMPPMGNQNQMGYSGSSKMHPNMMGPGPGPGGSQMPFNNQYPNQGQGE